MLRLATDIQQSYLSFKQIQILYAEQEC